MTNEKKSRHNSSGEIGCLKMKFFEKKKKFNKSRPRSTSLPPNNRIEIVIKGGKSVRGVFRNNSSGHIITDRRPTRVYSKPDKLSSYLGENFTPEGCYLTISDLLVHVLVWFSGNILFNPLYNIYVI